MSAFLWRPPARLEKEKSAMDKFIKKKLPRKITYQVYKIIIAYLINSNKITFDKRKVLVWIWNPDMIKRR